MVKKLACDALRLRGFFKLLLSPLLVVAETSFVGFVALGLVSIA